MESLKVEMKQHQSKKEHLSTNIPFFFPYQSRNKKRWSTYTVFIEIV